MLNSSFGSLYDSTPVRVPKNQNITLMGDAHFQEDGRLCLTSTSSSPPPSSSSFIGVGRALYTDPIRFKNSSNNPTTASFISKFTFTIIPDFSRYHPLFGDGFTFIIASKSNTIGNAFGYMGLSNQSSQDQGIYIAVEFDTCFDPTLEDISDNHIGIDVSSVLSYPIVDSTPTGFSLKNVSKTTIWIEYSDPEKLMKIWLSYDAESIPIRPILAARMDLSTYIDELMFVGFTASSGKLGSSKHIIHSWQFKTYPSPFDTSFSLHSMEEGSDLADGSGSTLWLLLGTLICTAISRIMIMFFSHDQIVGADQTTFDVLTDAPENPKKTVDGNNIEARRNVVNETPRLTKGTIKEALRSFQLEEIIEWFKSEIENKKVNLTIPVDGKTKGHYCGIIADLIKERDSLVSEKAELDKKVVKAGLQRKSKAELEDMLLQVKTKA
ncbi:hypothetical protein MKW92_030678 [Papaver armeniacum]|nr:hypothetical protein MKW92_030678 [Papaver armeniacum]